MRQHTTADASGELELEPDRCLWMSRILPGSPALRALIQPRHKRRKRPLGD
jgi:hypothetical protein